MIGTYYYNSVQQSISTRFTELNNVFTDESADSTTDFLSTAQKYIEDFPEKEQISLLQQMEPTKSRLSYFFL